MPEESTSESAVEKVRNQLLEIQSLISTGEAERIFENIRSLPEDIYKKDGRKFKRSISGKAPQIFTRKGKNITKNFLGFSRTSQLSLSNSVINGNGSLYIAPRGTIFRTGTDKDVGTSRGIRRVKLALGQDKNIYVMKMIEQTEEEAKESLKNAHEEMKLAKEFKIAPHSKASQRKSPHAEQYKTIIISEFKGLDLWAIFLSPDKDTNMLEISLQQKIDIMSVCLEQLLELRKKGYVYRDFKLENMAVAVELNANNKLQLKLKNNKPCLSIIDLESARKLPESGVLEDELFGTETYLSPTLAITSKCFHDLHPEIKSKLLGSFPILKNLLSGRFTLLGWPKCYYSFTTDLYAVYIMLEEMKKAIYNEVSSSSDETLKNNFTQFEEFLKKIREIVFSTVNQELEELLKIKRAGAKMFSPFAVQNQVEKIVKEYKKDMIVCNQSQSEQEKNRLFTIKEEPHFDDDLDAKAGEEAVQTVESSKTHNYQLLPQSEDLNNLLQQCIDNIDKEIERLENKTCAQFFVYSSDRSEMKLFTLKGLKSEILDLKNKEFSSNTQEEVCRKSEEWLKGLKDYAEQTRSHWIIKAVGVLTIIPTLLKLPRYAYDLCKGNALFFKPKSKESQPVKDTFTQLETLKTQFANKK